LKEEYTPICLIRKWCRLVEAYLIAYEGGMNIIQAEAFINKHRSHRSHSLKMDETLEQLFIQAIKNQELDNFNTATGDQVPTLGTEKTKNILRAMEQLYFPDENQVLTDDDIENMNDDDDIIINDEVLTTAITNGNQIGDDVIDDPTLLNNLLKIVEDVIITHILDLKSNGAITRSTSYYNHQDDDDDDDEINIFYNDNNVLQLDNDDIDIIEFIED